MRRPPAGSRWSTCTSRPASATPWACCTTRRRPAAPILVTAGQHEQSFNFTEPLLWADLPPIARPFVKWSAEVRRLEDLPRAIHRAAKTALAPPTGPVFLSLPGDVLTADGRARSRRADARRRRACAATRAAIAAAAALMARAERPVIMAGDAVPQSRRAAPNSSRWPRRSARRSMTRAWRAGRCSRPRIRCIAARFARLPAAIRGMLAEHDLLISVGADLFTLSLPGEVDPMPEGMPIIHLDTDPWELGKNYAGAVVDPRRSQGDAAGTDRGRRRRLRRGGRRDGRGPAHGGRGGRRRASLATSARAAPRPPPDARPIAAARADAARSAAVLPAECGGDRRDDLVRRRAAPAADSDDAQSFFGLRGGGIGWGLPAAIGAKLALPDRPVVALIGDGSAMYTIQGLWTAAHEKLSMVFVIINNSSYRILKQRINAMKAALRRRPTATWAWTSTTRRWISSPSRAGWA